MLWIVLGILLFLWMIQFGFGLGGYVVALLLIGICVASMIMLFIPARPTRE